MPVGWRLLLYFILAITAQQLWARVLDPLLYYLLSLRKFPLRRIAATDNPRFNRYVLEGFINYGPKWIPLVAGLLTGLLIPLIALVLYGAIALHYLFLLSITDEAYMSVLLARNYSRALANNLYSFGMFVLCALLCGVIFSLVRSRTVARYIHCEGRTRRFIWSSEFWGMLQGLFVYWLWAMWPRGYSGSFNFSHAVSTYFWLWMAFGFMYGWYFRSIHDFLIWQLARKQWTQGVGYTVLRILAALGNQSKIAVEVTTDGLVSIEPLNDPVTQERLKDLLNYFPGITMYSFRTTDVVTSEERASTP